tara:strand:- start:453 stop:680 length:228 start_codon:yes stop_codon:yes gene_type:complete
MRQFDFNGSTAISSVSVDGGNVSVQYTSSPQEYSFNTPNPESFLTDLENTIDSEGSMGGFIHQCRTNGSLVEVTV